LTGEQGVVISRSDEVVTVTTNNAKGLLPTASFIDQEIGSIVLNAAC
jgi:hypothetical protein